MISFIFEKRDPLTLTPYAKNARTHDAAQVEKLSRMILEFGFINPILLDKKGVIIAGHARLLAAKKLGLAEVPVIELDGLTDAQVRALRLADNKIALNAGWDTDLLRDEIEQLAALDNEIDIELTGFATGEIDTILGDEVDPDDEVIPAPRAEPRTKLGDIWELGNHRIGCGDSRDAAFLRAVLGEEQVDCAFLDPPYNVAIQGHANVKRSHKNFAMAVGEMSDEAFRTFLSDILRNCADVSRNGAVHFICMDWRHYEALCAVCSAIYDEHLNLCIWNKSNAGMGSLYRSKYELISVHRTGNAQHRNNVRLGRNGRNRTNVWNYGSVNTFNSSRRNDLKLHPTVKPIAMVADAIQDVTQRGDLILDTFSGAGTTLIACEQTGRRFRGIDLDPTYVDIAIDRWAAMTNSTPKLVTKN